VALLTERMSCGVVRSVRRWKPLRGRARHRRRRSLARLRYMGRVTEKSCSDLHVWEGES
jgi:hypothetical protein